jgi:porin
MLAPADSVGTADAVAKPFRYRDPPGPVRIFESLVTALYQYEVRGGSTLQLTPGAGATSPIGPNAGKAFKDAAVFCLRTVLKFLSGDCVGPGWNQGTRW